MRTIKLTIWLTHNCNMDCIYCYEREKYNSYMNFEIADNICKYIYRLLKENEIQICYVSFHGGEPFLESKLIAFFLEKFLEIKNVKFIYSVTTNGTIMNEEVISCLSLIDDVNLSIDGTSKTQINNRPMLNGKDSSVLLEKNISVLNERNIEFNARMTVTFENLEKIEEHIQYLYDLGVKNVICNLDLWNHLWSEEEIRKYLIVLKKCINKYDYDIHFKIYGIMDSVETIKGNCMGGIKNIIIDCDGSLYPCIVVCGEKKYCIGNIIQNINKSWKEKLMEYNTYNEKECLQCVHKAKCSARRCVFLKKTSKILFRNMCLIQKLGTNTY